MPSVAIFCSKFTNEKEILHKLRTLLGLEVITDGDIIDEACDRQLAIRNKLEQALYKKTSVFNQFTLERERNVAHLKFILAERLAQKQNEIYYGFTSLLIPNDITHVLKVLVIDSSDMRCKRAVNEGIPEKEAAQIIREEDISAYSWTDFLFHKEAFDKSLYDIVIPVGGKNSDDIINLIQENLNKPAVLETEESIQAVKDFALTAKVENALLSKGQRVEVETHNGCVSLKVTKGSFNFNRLTEKLSAIAGSVPGVKDVEVLQGKGHITSIYRDQNFELPPKVLLVDDEKEYVQTLSERLTTRNMGPYAVYDGQQALNFVDTDKPDVMVLDLKMPGINGIEVLQQIKKTNPNIEVIILTGHGSEADRETCMNLGAYAYLQKPTDVEKISATIAEAYKKITAKKAIA